MRADEVAHVVGKSASTAYYLLASLVEEGFAVHEGGLYRPHHEVVTAPPPAEPTATRSRTPSTTSSCAPTSAATSASCARGVIEITVVRGRQGIARMPGLGTQITDNAHALAMGKVVLARLRPAALARYVARGLHALHAEHDHRARRARARAARRCARNGYAVEREEFDEDFCCVAAPVARRARPAAPAILGLSASTRAFDAEHDELAAAVREPWPPRPVRWRCRA